jgi:hypothetical protein
VHGARPPPRRSSRKRAQAADEKTGGKRACMAELKAADG